MDADINYIGSCDRDELKKSEEEACYEDEGVIVGIGDKTYMDIKGDSAMVLQNKDESIIIYNDRNELKEISDAFIIGRINIDYNYHNDDTKYELKFIKKNNEEFTVGLFTPQETQESKYVTIPFMAFDSGKSTRQELSKVTLIINGTESSSIKLTKLK